MLFPPYVFGHCNSIAQIWFPNRGNVARLERKRRSRRHACYLLVHLVHYQSTKCIVIVTEKVAAM